MLRGNSRLRTHLGVRRTAFLIHALESFERLLPHLEIKNFSQADWEDKYVSWKDKHKKIDICIPVGKETDSKSASLLFTVERRTVISSLPLKKRTIHEREYKLCGLIVDRILEVLALQFSNDDELSILSLTENFDEHVVTRNIKNHNKLKIDVAEIISAMHRLSESTYENKAMTFGCIVDPDTEKKIEKTFPTKLLEQKKYRALSDGFRTAYIVSNDSALDDFIDLEEFEKHRSFSGKHYFPEWTKYFARASRDGFCGICLSRQGDILIFDGGTLRFTYRYGKWQYWNHEYLIDLLHKKGRSQKVSNAIRRKVVNAVYRAALDVSFRRCGGLFIVLKNKTDLLEIIKSNEVIGASKSSAADTQFDQILSKHNSVQAIDRSIIVDIAALDGAVVLESSGKIRAYAVVLDPSVKLRGIETEGSRTKAALGASMFGLAIKISSDGDITVFHEGEKFIRV